MPSEGERWLAEHRAKAQAEDRRFIVWLLWWVLCALFPAALVYVFVLPSWFTDQWGEWYFVAVFATLATYALQDRR